MRKHRKSRSTRHPVIGIAVDGASAYGRGIMRGVMQYANAQRRWEICSIIRGTLEAGHRDWPVCDGAICAGVGTDILQSIRDHSRHVIVCSGSAFEKGERNVVCVDDLATGAMAAEHLMECRPASFAFVGVPNSPHSIQRLTGFAKTLAQNGCNYVNSPFMHPGIFQNLKHWPALIEWITHLPRPTAIFTVDDTVANDVAAACLRARIEIPEHVAILGVNNDDLLCESAWPPISSIDCGYPRIGYAAAHLMSRLLAGASVRREQRRIRMPPLSIVRRRSTDVLAVTDPTIAEALRFIREHACDPCSVDDVRKHLTMSRRSLELKFATKLDRTPHDEILRVQMEAARKLLLLPGMTLPVVAERCGFSDQSAFGRAFRRVLGRSPSAYRRDVVIAP